MDVYTDASADGTLAILPIGKEPIVNRSRLRGSTNMNQLEYEALSQAIETFGPECRYYCDNLNARDKARKRFPGYEILSVLGRANPADPYTRYYKR
jgi:hypothetical protein